MVFYLKWINVIYFILIGKIIIKSYQSKLFTIVRPEVLVKGKTLSRNSPEHGPKNINQALNRQKGTTAFSGAAGIYHFINSVDVFLSSRNENFLEGR